MSELETAAKVASPDQELAPGSKSGRCSAKHQGLGC
jgi:hypothetical protein